MNGIKLNQMHYKSPLIGEGGVISSNVVFSNVEVEGLIQVVLKVLSLHWNLTERH